MIMNSKNDSHDESQKEVQSSAIQSSAIQVPEVQGSAIQGSAIQVPEVQSSVTHVSDDTAVTESIINIVIPTNVLNDRNLSSGIKKCFERFWNKIADYDISSAGNKILVTYNGKVSEYEIDDGRVIPLADIFRWYIFNVEKIGLVKVNHRRLQYIAVAFDDHLGVIVDIINNKTMGFVDAADVRYVNAFTTSLHTQGSDSYRFLESVTINDTSIALQLSHVIFCAHSNFFPSNTFHIHHVNNPCDNRFEFLETRKPYSYHPPREVSSDAYIAHVIESMGYTVDEFTSICVNKALELKNSK